MKVIAVAPPHKNELKFYTSWLEKRRLEYRILGNNEKLGGKYSALMLCGGADVGKRPERDSRETRLLEEAYGKIPVFGICRGLQMANVFLGGTLVEDISEADHQKHTANEYHESSKHYVTLISEEEIEVNSRHHQSIDKLGDGLTIAAISSDDIVEAVTGNLSLFVQWHPERDEMYGTPGEEMCYKWLKTFID